MKLMKDGGSKYHIMHYNRPSWKNMLLTLCGQWMDWSEYRTDIKFGEIWDDVNVCPQCKVQYNLLYVDARGAR